MSRPFAVLFAFFLTAAAEGGPLPHASGAPAGPGPGCGGGFTAARGDTLYSIARRCETSVAELVQENRLGRPTELAAGQELDIPGFAEREGPKPPEAGPPPPRDLLPPQIRTRPDRGGPPPPLPARREAGVYRFQAGDTLFSLARWARVSLPALLAANRGIDPAGIAAGTPISLPAGAARPEVLRARERGGAMVRPAVRLPVLPMVRPEPPRPPRMRPAPPPEVDEADKPKPDDEDEDDGPTPGGMDDGGPEPDGM
jgi:LysM repeat protein